MRATDEIRFRALREGVFAYAARVPAGDFQWRDDLEVSPGSHKGPVPEAPFLVGPVPDGVEFTEKVGPLFRHKGKAPQLHRAFARLDGSPEQILAFANRYGALREGEVGLQERTLRRREGSLREYDVRLFHGEPLAAWRAEVAAMVQLVDLWNAVLLPDASKLAAAVEWTDSPRRVVIHPQGKGVNRPWSVVAHEEQPEERELLARWRPGDTREPVRFYVHLQVNRRLRGHVSPAVLPYVEDGSRIAHFPDSLLAALYVLFALELAEEKPVKRCKYERCPYGRTFTPTRSNQDYCSEQCKRNASYHRVNDRRLEP